MLSVFNLCIIKRDQCSLVPFIICEFLLLEVVQKVTK